MTTMTDKLAEQINQEATIWFKYINGKGCAINSHATNWNSKDATTTLLFYYDHKTYLATYNDNKQCTLVKETL